MTDRDMEKTYAVLERDAGTDLESPKSSHDVEQPGKAGVFQRWNSRIENLAGFEARGLARVPDEERQPASLMGLLQMFLLWLSANATLLNMTVGFLGPVVFSLGFLDSALCAIFGILLGSLTTAYMSIWGAVSGNRTMVSSMPQTESI